MFTVQLSTGIVERVSVGPSGRQLDRLSGLRAASSDGTHVVFDAHDSALVGPYNEPVLMIYDAATKQALPLLQTIADPSSTDQTTRR